MNEPADREEKQKSGNFAEAMSRIEYARGPERLKYKHLRPTLELTMWQGEYYFNPANHSQLDGNHRKL